MVLLRMYKALLFRKTKGSLIAAIILTPQMHGCTGLIVVLHINGIY